MIFAKNFPPKIKATKLRSIP